MAAEFRDGKIYIGDYECQPKEDVPGPIADFTLAFLGIEKPEYKEAVLRDVGYESFIGHGAADTASMTPEQYGHHLDRSLLLAILDNELHQPGF